MSNLILVGNLGGAPAVEVAEVGQQTLPELARQINEHAQASQTHALNATERAIMAGRMLAQARELVPHGGWDNWLQENCVLAPRTARSYMRLAKTFASLPEANRQRVAEMPVREAVHAITMDPTAPPRVRTARAPYAKDERARVVERLRKAATGVREAAKLLSGNMDIKPAKVTELRNKLTAVLADIDRMQAGEATHAE